MFIFLSSLLLFRRGNTSLSHMLHHWTEDMWTCRVLIWFSWYNIILTLKWCWKHWSKWLKFYFKMQNLSYIGWFYFAAGYFWALLHPYVFIFHCIHFILCKTAVTSDLVTVGWSLSTNRISLIKNLSTAALSRWEAVEYIKWYQQEIQEDEKQICSTYKFNNSQGRKRNWHHYEVETLYSPQDVTTFQAVFQRLFPLKVRTWDRDRKRRTKKNVVEFREIYYLLTNREVWFYSNYKCNYSNDFLTLLLFHSFLSAGCLLFFWVCVECFVRVVVMGC